ncbi:hypothetical protein [Dermabacter hominis]
MTLTLETALHAIDKYGKIFNIVDDADPLSAYSVTREQAIESNKLRYQFTPCIVVTTAREALEAAWELAHETREIPAHTPHIFRASDTNIQVSNGEPGDLYAGHGRLRLIDPPEPEPWELSRYCHADGLFLERQKDEHGTFWRTVEKTPEAYDRAELATHNPRPVTIEGEKE